MKPLRVAFVGMKRPPSDLPPEYWPTFVRFHMELPWYYARYSNCEIDVTTVEPVSYSEDFRAVGGGTIRTITEGQYLNPLFDQESAPYDVVVHWRKWFDDLYMLGARNVMLTQDHTYSCEWRDNVQLALVRNQLEGILVFPTWHKENTLAELGPIGVTSRHLYAGLTFGVDTSVYEPIAKDPFKLLWASDPGRGLDGLVDPFLKLWNRDRRFRLTVTYPDYVKPESVARFAGFFKHPGVIHKPSVRNGPELWDLFNGAGFLPYTSNFQEPSSRCHRQAMAAGCVVLYPPNMGTPSRLLEDGLTGIVSLPDLWPDVIQSLVSTGRHSEIGQNARALAVSESWAVQAARFHSFFSKAKP